MGFPLTLDFFSLGHLLRFSAILKLPQCWMFQIRIQQRWLLLFIIKKWIKFPKVFLFLGKESTDFRKFFKVVILRSFFSKNADAVRSFFILKLILWILIFSGKSSACFRFVCLFVYLFFVLLSRTYIVYKFSQFSIQRDP
jgi:hypothetical protein